MGTRGHNGLFSNFLSGRGAVLAAVIAGCLAATAAMGQEQACCDLSGKDHTCYQDVLGKGSTCAPEMSLGDGTTCATHCLCGGNCNTCVSKEGGDESRFEVQLVSAIYGGTNTVFTYRVCELPTSQFDMLSWTLELTSACCERFVEATGGTDRTRDCDPNDPGIFDPETGLAGIRFEVFNLPTCVGFCGTSGELFTVTLSGNVGVGCTRAANVSKEQELAAHGGGVANTEREDVSMACIAGPSCAPGGACCDHALPGGVCTDNVEEAECLATGEQPEFFDNLTCEQVEALLLCEEHTGACCDHALPGGVCTDGVTESACLATAEQPAFYKGLSCLEVESLGGCEEHTGACCDHAQPGGFCVDGVFESACIGDQAQFFKGLTCADVENLGFCLEHTGACCDASQPGGLCTDGVPGSQCFGDQVTYYKGLLCSDLSPPCVEHTGACCEHAEPGGLCIDGVPGSVCISGLGFEQPEFFKDLTCLDVEAGGFCEEHTGACCEHVLPGGECREGVTESACMNAGQQPEFFKGMTCADVENLGLCQEHAGACCDRAQPGGVCTDPIPESQCTGVQVFFFKGMTCMGVEAFALCPEHTGACCDHSTPGGVCLDAVPESVCLASGAQPQFFKDVTCAAVEAIGGCGEHIGACCDRRLPDPGLRCRDNIAESMCIIDDPTQVSWTKGVLCADLQPPCTEHTGACCDRRIADPLLRCREYIPQSQCLIDDASQVSWTKGTLCADLQPECTEHTGACCDRRIADPLLRCRDDIPQSQCVIDDPDQVSWTKGALCADLDPLCTEHTGACCDLRIVNPALRCVNNVPASQCVIDDPLQVFWYKSTTCEELGPPCQVEIGACCDEDTFGSCQTTSAEECTCATCVFYQDLTCEQVTCSHRPIPTVSQWGLVVLALLLLTGAKVYFRRRSDVTAA